MKIYASRGTSEYDMSFDLDPYIDKDVWVKSYIGRYPYWVNVMYRFTDGEDTPCYCAAVIPAEVKFEFSDFESLCNEDIERQFCGLFRLATPVEILTTEELKEACIEGQA